MMSIMMFLRRQRVMLVLQRVDLFRKEYDARYGYGDKYRKSDYGGHEVFDDRII